MARLGGSEPELAPVPRRWSGDEPSGDRGPRWSSPWSRQSSSDSQRRSGPIG